MAMTEAELRMSARIAILEEHVGHENRHDLDGIMQTFGAEARYDDEPWGDHRMDRDGVRAFYADLMQAIPNLQIDVRQRHVTEAAIVLEVVIRGRHLGPWRGLLPTGRDLEFPLCGIFTFDDQDRLACEKIYYDRATVLRQLGVFHEPDRMLGRLGAVLMHPLTIARTLIRAMSK